MCGRIAIENHSQGRKLYAYRNRALYPRRNKRQRAGRFEEKAVNSKAFGMAFIRAGTSFGTPY